MSLINWRGKIKGWFFLSGVNRLIPPDVFLFLGHMSKLSKWIHAHKKIHFCDFYTSQFNYPKRYDLYSFLIEKENLQQIDYLEFGVSKGFSFRWWAEKITHPESKFYGFDTFTGLPEDWGPFKKGDMANNNAPPDIQDQRCTFFQGLFQQTLPGFLKNYHSEKRKVIHMDADLYSSTLFVLTSISPYLKKGDIIMFDEFNVPMHEFKAFTEWVSSFYINYEVLGSVNNFYQTAVKII